MDGLLALPVSAVEPDWIHTTFRPQLQNAVGELQYGGVLWLHVDAGAEGDYLLSYTDNWAKSTRRHAGELRVWEEDPFLVWEDLLGTPDQSPASWSWPSGTIISARNGTALPVRFLQDRGPILASYCRARGWVLIIPVLHNAMRYVREACDPAVHVVAPPFGSIGEDRRRALVDAMVRADLPSLSGDLRASLIQQLVTTEPPAASRTELQAWVDFYRDKPDVETALRHSPPPPIPRHSGLPADPPPALTLKSRMNVVVETFREASNAFSRWSGRPLFGLVYEPPDPFQASDPVHWFSATISYLSCLLDSADQALDPLLLYEYNPATADIETGSPPRLYSVLRRLRTAMQHGLNPSSASDRETIDAVRGWYYSYCGSHTPARHHWRKLTCYLLEEAETAAKRLAICTAQASVCSSRAVVESQLRVYARSLSKEDWRKQLRASINALAPGLDADRVLDKHIGDLQKDLRESTVVTQGVFTRARELTDALVLSEAARCPVTPTDLLGLGIRQGPQLGLIHRKIEVAWQRDLNQSRDALLEIARALRDNL